MAIRPRHRRILPLLGGLSFADYFTSLTNMVTWILQESSGDVAGATNEAATGRNVATLTYAAYTAGANWANSSAQIARHTAGAVATIQQDGIIAAGKTWEYVVVMSNRTAGSVTITGGDAPVSANGSTTVTITATGADVIITPSSDFDGDIDLAQGTVKQTGILDSDDYPGAEELDETGASGTATAANWLAQSGAILSNPSTGLLKIERNGTGFGTARQVPLIAGIWYIYYVETRSDGNATARLQDTSNILDLGTTSTNWEVLQGEFVSSGSEFKIVCLASVDGEYIECRKISVKPANPYNGDVTGAGIVTVNAGNIVRMRDCDGINDEINKTSAELNSTTKPLDTGFGVFVQKDTWDAAIRSFVSFYVDANNWMRIGGTATLGQIYYQYRENGNTKEVLYATGSPTTTFYPYMIIDGTNMLAIYNGVQVGSVAITGDFVGNFSSIFVASNDGANFHLGKVAYDATDTTAPSVPDILERWQRSGI